MKQSKPTADITLVLEGTYPFVSGGLAQWVHQIISGLPQFQFSLVFLGSTADDYSKPRFSLPDNVCRLKSIYLWQPDEVFQPRHRSGSERLFEDIRSLNDWFSCPGNRLHDALITRLFATLANPSTSAMADMLFSQGAWNLLCQHYSKSENNQGSFEHFFWAVRLMHAPLLRLIWASRDIPPTRAIHAVSNGYAGFLGAVLHRLTRRPLILTEHGIYAKERKIDLQASYMPSDRDYFATPPPRGMQDHEYLWIRHFESLSRLVYAEARVILSCHEANRRRQIRELADPLKTRVIPNGIDVRNYLRLREYRPKRIPQVLGLIGRLVPIKDIKTFIRAMRILVDRMPEAEGWLIGPEAEDPQYGEECKQLAATLGLEGHVRFLGFQDLNTLFPKLGLLVLTSISEAFPLVILEAFAAGLPVLSTDVGACRELIEGNHPDDRALGSAGAVVPIANPEATAGAALTLLSDDALWHGAQQAAIARVERFYTESRLLSSYADIYSAAVNS